MSISYTWEITTVKKINQHSYSNVVVQVYWSKTGTDENNRTGTFNGVTPLSALNLPPEDFISSEQLSHDIILSWIQADINSKEGFEEHINARIMAEM
jgi:hypothetical protein